MRGRRLWHLIGGNSAFFFLNKMFTWGSDGGMFWKKRRQSESQQSRRQATISGTVSAIHERKLMDVSTPGYSLCFNLIILALFIVLLNEK
jgi:hypothetical protein